MNKEKVAFVTGITGQDGSYLTEQLIAKGYKVVGLVRRASTNNLGRIDHISSKNLKLEYGDLLDKGCLTKLLREYMPDEIYNLGAQSHVFHSFAMPEYTIQTIITGTLNLLDAMKEQVPWARFYQASSSEMFGVSVNSLGLQDENTQFDPVSPYACGKVAAHNLVRQYRRSYGLHLSAGILFNHESPRRGEEFVTRKITKYIGELVNSVDVNRHPKLTLGNLDAQRDWGAAFEYTEAMHLILQQEHPDDYVICTGEANSVRDFLDLAFGHVNLNWQDFVKTTLTLHRPSEVPFLRGDNSKAKEILGWEPKIKLPELVRIMVDSDVQKAKTLQKQ